MSIKFGIIGCGSIATHRHLPELADNPSAEIVAVCDIVKSRAQEKAKQYNAVAYTDYKELLSDKEIERQTMITL